jgi:tetratricopeptide (TPR) repeat protein
LSAGHTDRGWFFFQRKRYSDALSCCHDALRENPRDEDAFYLGSFSALMLDDRETAREMAGQLIGIDPQSAGGHELLGHLALADEHEQKAERHFREAIRCDPQSSGRYATLGAFLARRGRLEEAITSARKGLKELYRLNEEPKLAQEMGDRAAEINPEDADVHFEAGLLLLRKGQKADARGRFAESLRLDPASGQAFSVIAHERVRHWKVFKNGYFMPLKVGMIIAVLLAPAMWFGLSLLWQPLIWVFYLSLVIIVGGYLYTGLFYMCRWSIQRRLERGRL